MTASPPRPPRGGTDVAGSPDVAAWDACVEANPLGSYLQLDGWARVKAVNGWSARRLLDARGGAGAQVLLRRPGPAAVGVRLRAARPGPRRAGTRRPSRASRTSPGTACAARGRVSHLRIDPEIERGGDRDADGAVTGALEAAGWRAAAAIQPVSTRVDRPRRRRGRPVGRPAQEVAPVREQGPLGRRAGRRRRPGAPRRVLRDLPRDRGPGRVPDPGEVRLPRRVGRLRPGRPCPPAVRGAAPTATPVATLFLVRAGSRVVEPYGGMTQAGADEPRELPAQVGGDPELEGAGRHELRPVGPRPRRASPTSRPGFGGREIHYVGAWDLVLDPLGRRTYAVAQGARVRRRAVAPRPARRRRAVGRGIRGRRRGRRVTRRPAPRAARDARRLGRARRSTPRAATSSSRGPGRRTARRRAGRRASTRSATPRALVARPAVAVARRRLGVRAPRPGACGRRPGRATAPAARGRTGARRARRPPVRRRDRRARRGSRGRRRRRGLPRARSTPSGSTASPRSSRRATGWRSRSPPARTRPALFDGIAKATRQRIRRAERDGVVVVRWDAASTELEGHGRARPRTGPTPSTASTPCSARPATGAASGSRVREEFVTWWTPRARRRPPRLSRGPRGARRRRRPRRARPVPPRHRLSTAHSGDRAERRRDHPGAMHLLRWRAIQLALAEGRTEMDLGGVDVAGRPPDPAEGEPTYGLYEHKRSFGAAWVAMAGAQERVAAAGGTRWAGHDEARARREPGDRTARRPADPTAVERLIAAAEPAEPRAARAACSPAWTRAASCGGAAGRPAAGVARPGGRGRPGRRGGLAAGAGGHAVRRRARVPRGRPRVRGQARRPARPRRSWSTPSGRRVAAARRRRGAARARAAPRLVVRRPVALARGRRGHGHGRQDDDLVPRPGGARGRGLSAGLMGTVETKVGATASATRPT